MLLSSADQLKWHDEWRNHIVSMTTTTRRDRIPADAGYRFGVCLAVINGTYQTLAIVEIPENGPDEPRHIFDFDITTVSRIGTGQERGDTAAERTILKALMRDGDFKVRYQDDGYQTAKGMQGYGLLRVVSIEKSPTGFTTFQLTQLGRCTALIRGIRT